MALVEDPSAALRCDRCGSSQRVALRFEDRPGGPRSYYCESCLDAVKQHALRAVVDARAADRDGGAVAQEPEPAT